MQNIILQLDNYNKELKDIHTELEALPLGRLVKKNKSYIHVIDYKRIGISKELTLIQQLARKKYLLARKKQLTNNIKGFSHPTAKHDNRLPKEIIDTFSTTYQSLPHTHFYHPSIEKWSKAPYRKNTLHPESLIYQSRNGIYFRSKSERDIANLLEEYQLPYRYDAVIPLKRYDEIISLDEIEISPDFIIKNPYNNKTIIWEHFGSLHKADYEQSMNDKIDRYLTRGFAENDDLIYTFEAHTRDHRRIQNLIENIIL